MHNIFIKKMLHMLFEFYQMYPNIFEMRIQLPANIISALVKGLVELMRLTNANIRSKLRLDVFCKISKINFLLPVL